MAKKDFMRELALMGARHVIIDLERQKLELYKRFPELSTVGTAPEEPVSNGKRRTKRKHSPRFKSKVVREAGKHGVTVTARRHDLHTSLVTKWVKARSS